MLDFLSVILSALIATAGTIIVALISKNTNKKVEKMESIKSEFKTEINNFRKEYDKTYLTDFLSELESGAQKSEIQLQRAHEIYSEYTDELKGNSYIHTKWSDLEKKGLL